MSKSTEVMKLQHDNRGNYPFPCEQKRENVIERFNS